MHGAWCESDKEFDTYSQAVEEDRTEGKRVKAITREQDAYRQNRVFHKIYQHGLLPSQICFRAIVMVFGLVSNLYIRDKLPKTVLNKHRSSYDRAQRPLRLESNTADPPVHHVI